MVTSNRSVGEWGEVFGDAVVATAILDRLLDHSHVLTITGESSRCARSALAARSTPPPRPRLPRLRRDRAFDLPEVNRLRLPRP